MITGGRLPDSLPHYSIGFGDAVRRAYRKAFVVEGRASPSEYWWFALFTLIVYLGVGVLGATVNAAAEGIGVDLTLLLGFAYLALMAFLAVPGFTLTIRRLHDAGFSGWAYLSCLIPLVGSLVLFILILHGPRPAGDRYGPSSLPQQYTMSTQRTMAARRRSSGRVGAVVVVALVLLAGASIPTFLFVVPKLQEASAMGAGSGTDWTDPAAYPTQTQGPYYEDPDTEAPSAQETYPEEWWSSEAPTSAEPTPSDDESDRAVTDAPGTPYSSVAVVDSSAGKACKTSDDELTWGYPAATCRAWKKAEGLITGGSLAKGRHVVACQRDLMMDNPVFATGQSNTWWVWVQSDSGSWDWFPETAIAEGVSDQSINGIAVCEDA